MALTWEGKSTSLESKFVNLHELGQVVNSYVDAGDFACTSLMLMHLDGLLRTPSLSVRLGAHLYIVQGRTPL